MEMIKNSLFNIMRDKLYVELIERNEEELIDKLYEEYWEILESPQLYNILETQLISEIRN